ncbi:conserved hypothetical protein [Vibrio crassostreae]|nr:conserved hypothetical protein [Vibrio crassostreae]
MEENKRGYSKACYYADEPQAVVHWWKKTMLDARFDARLEARIEQAKLN